MKVMRWLVVLALLAALAIGCGGTTPPPDPDENPAPITEEQIDAALTVVELEANAATVKPSTQIRNSVLPIGKNRLAAVVSVDRTTGTIVFDKSLLDSAALAKMVPDTILAGYHPQRAKRGFLRRVTSVTDAGTQLSVVTQPAKLKDVFAGGGFRVQRRNTVNAASKLILADGQVLPMKVQGSGANARGLVNLPIEKTFCPVNTDGNKNTKNDQLCITGSIDFDLGFDFSFDCEGILCTNPYLDTHVTFTESAKLKVEGQLSRTIDKNYLIGKATLGSFTIPVLSVPLVFVAQLEIRLLLNGTVSVGLKYVAEQNLEITAGVELKDGNFKPYTKFDNDVETSSVDVSIDATAKATLSGELSVLLYGITGPTLSAEAWAKLEAGFPRNPTWELTAGLDWFIGVKLDLFGLVNLDWDKRLTGLKWNIGEAKNTKPVVVLKNPVDEEEMTLPNELDPSILEAYYVDFDVKTEDNQDRAKALVRV
jgi:predicted small lipoprotein YifL